MRPQTKVAFVGTSCVGKTTLLERCRVEHGNVDGVCFVDEAARAYFASHPDIPTSERFRAPAQGQVQLLALRAELRAHRSGSGLILCDRSVLDAVAYVRAAEGIERSRPLLSRVRSWIPTYQRMFLLDPSDIPYRVDDVRRESARVRARFHQAFVQVLEEERVEYELLSGDIDARIATVRAKLRELAPSMRRQGRGG